MASSSDPEKDSNKSQSMSDNPFIRFRQFADQQISSLLQGIIGLPSAFSGKPSENPRWAVFDDDLRRRDELQARQQELKESEARRLDRRSTNEEVDIPVKKSPDWGAFPRWHDNVPKTNQDNEGMRDLPLYGPVTKSLFAHLSQPADSDVDWNSKEHLLDPWREAGEAHFRIRQDQLPSDCLRMTQHLVYSRLNTSPKLRSDYSLLPYLMFSPYSPIRLIESRSIYSRSQAQDTFPYCDAFEDLIRTTQPAQRPTPFSQLFIPFRGYKYFDALANGPSYVTVTRALLHETWIEHLHKSNLLQESEIGSLPRERTAFPRSPPFPFASTYPESVESVTEMSTSDEKLASKEAQTEQEMYDHFLRWASKPSAVTETMETVLAEARAAFAKQLKSDEVPDLPRAFNELMESKLVRELLGEFEPDKQNQAERKPGTTNPVEDPDKVVSEHTVTQRVKQVDGSVQTYVSVWKMFADGRETTTTTSHTEEQERDENGSLKPLVYMAEESKALSEKAEKEAEVKKVQKKGWFWN